MSRDNSVIPIPTDLQCSKCKVVINEALAFISNKVDVLPETAILEICLTAYSGDEIEVARNIAYKMLAPTKKFMRRKDGGEQKSILEMVKLIKEFDPDGLPNFVAKDLNKIPPVSFNYIDSTSFLKEIAILRNDVAIIKAEKQTRSDSSSSVSEIEGLKAEVAEVKSLLKELQHHIRNSSKCIQQFDIVELNTQQEEKCNVRQSIACETRKRDSANKNKSSSRISPAPGTSSKQSVMRSPSHVSSPRKGQSAVAMHTHVPLYRDIVISSNVLQARERSTAENDDRNEASFITVERKKRKRIYNMIGTAKYSNKLQIADLTSSIYISRLNKTTNLDDVKDYLKEKGEECSKIELLTQKHETDFCSYKLTVPRRKLDIFLSNDFWPEGVKFRMFRDSAPRGNKHLKQ